MVKIGEILASAAGGLSAGGALNKTARKKAGEVLFGTDDKVEKLKTLTPEQEQLMSLIQQGITEGEGPLKDLFGEFDKEGFDQGVTQPALKHFMENILPQIQGSFTGNQAQSSAARRANLKAGTDLQSQLNQLMYQAQQGQQQNRLQGVNTALNTKGFENIYKQGKTGIIPAFAQGAGQAAGQIATAAIAG